MVDAFTSFALPVVDLANSQSDRREDYARRAAEEFISEEIDPAAGPLFAARVFKLSTQDHVLVLGIDHLVSDAVSWSILTREVLMLYGSGVTCKNYPLPQLSIQFPDFAVWQAGTQEAWERSYAAYWRGRLAGTEKVLVPLDHRDASGYTKREFRHIPLGRALSASLADLARQHGSSMALVVLSIQLVIMSQWCHRSTLLVEFFSHGRQGSLALRNMIGFLAYPMYLLAEVVSGETFGDLLRRVAEEYRSALEHDASRATGNLVSGCPTEVQFNWVQTDLTHEKSSRGMGQDVRLLRFPITKPVNTSFSPHYYPTTSGIVAEIWYGNGLIEKRTLDWLEDGLRSITQEVARNPQVYIGTLQSLCAR